MAYNDPAFIEECTKYIREYIREEIRKEVQREFAKCEDMAWDPVRDRWIVRPAALARNTESPRHVAIAALKDAAENSRDSRARVEAAATLLLHDDQ